MLGCGSGTSAPSAAFICAAAVLSIRPGFRSDLLQSAASLSISEPSAEKKCFKPLERKAADPCKSRHNLLNTKPNLGNNLASAGKLGLFSRSRWKAYWYLFSNLPDSLQRLRAHSGWKQIPPCTFMTMVSPNWSTNHGSQKHHIWSAW